MSTKSKKHHHHHHHHHKQSQNQNQQPVLSDKEKSDAVLQRYNVELLKCLDDMKYRRDDIHKEILTLQNEQIKIQSDLGELTSRLSKINESICHKISEQENCDRTIAEYEVAFTKLIEGSENLLTSLKHAVETVLPDIVLHNREPTQASTNAGASRLSKRSRSQSQSTGSHPSQSPNTGIQKQSSLVRTDTETTT